MSKMLVTGCTGQDGTYLCERLSRAGHQVFGLVRGQSLQSRDRLLSFAPDVILVGGDLLDSASLVRAFAASEPDVVFNLAGVSAPALGWSQPELTCDVTGLGFVRLLEAARFACPQARIVHAGSLALHGPYGAAKEFTRMVAVDYRKRGSHVTVAVFGGHHSPRRGREFFSRIVTSGVARIARGEQDKLTLGWLGRSQDWGWAPDFMNAFSLLPDLDPDDYVISTGEPHTSQEWVTAAFAAAGMDWRDYVTLDDSRSQPTDVAQLSGEPDARLPWRPRRNFDGLAAWMVDEEML
jgi:GDPmannose 4,6-dehydratase